MQGICWEGERLALKREPTVLEMAPRNLGARLRAAGQHAGNPGSGHCKYRET